MARMSLTGFDDVEKMFEALGKPEEFAIKAVKKAAPILEKHVQKNVRESSNSEKLAHSFSMTPVRENALGVYSVVRPTGDFNEDLTNAELAAQFEFGRKGGYKRHEMQRPATEMQPKPWRTKSLNDAKDECESIMQEEVYKAVDEAVK